MIIVHRNADGTVLDKYAVRNGKDASYILVGLLLGRDMTLRPGDSVTIEEGEELKWEH